MPRYTVAFLRFAHESGKPHITSHACPVALAGDVAARLLREYGEEPTSVTYRHGVWLDADGCVLLDQPTIRVRLRGYSVCFKYEHAPYLAINLAKRLEDTGRRRVYGGRECVTVYQQFSIAVIPVDDARVVLRALKRHSLGGLKVGMERKAELAACEGIDVGIVPGDA